MNKSDLISKLAESMNISKTEAGRAVKNVFEIMADCLEQKQCVRLHGLGTFEVCTVPERIAINPKTKDEVFVPQHYRIAFRPSNKLRNNLNEGIFKTKT